MTEWGLPTPLINNYPVVRATQPEPRALSSAAAPALSDQTELLGRYESPGLTDERYLVRRGDGQVILLTLVLWLIASGLEARHDLERVAEDVTARLGQSVTAATIAAVIDAKIKPLGILAGQTVVAPASPRAPLLSLTLRGVLVPGSVVRRLAGVLRPCYWPVSVVVALLALAATDWWLFATQSISGAFASIANKPVLFLPVFGLVVAGTLWHEIGHATACAYGGGKPGRIGFGCYLVFPAFYTDVTDTYRLTKWARVRTDLGGVYFNGLFCSVLIGVYHSTGYLPIVPTVVLIHLAMIQQMLPFVRLDGYYVLSDLVGVPDLFARMSPWRGTIRGHTDLRPSARRIVRAWVVATIPVLVGGFALFLWHSPRLARDTYRSAQLQWTVADLSARAHHWTTVALAAISLVLLSVPVLGLAAFVLRLLKRVAHLPTKGAHMKGRAT